MICPRRILTSVGHHGLSGPLWNQVSLPHKKWLFVSQLGTDTVATPTVIYKEVAYRAQCSPLTDPSKKDLRPLTLHCDHKCPAMHSRSLMSLFFPSHNKNKTTQLTSLHIQTTALEMWSTPMRTGSLCPPCSHWASVQQRHAMGQNHLQTEDAQERRNTKARSEGTYMECQGCGGGNRQVFGCAGQPA